MPRIDIAMGDGNIAPVLGENLAQSLGYDYAAVAAAGAADTYYELGLALVHIVGYKGSYHIVELIEKFKRLGKIHNIIAHGGLEPAVGLEIFDIKGIGQKAHVKHEVGVGGNTVLKTEGAALDSEVALLARSVNIGDDTL